MRSGCFGPGTSTSAKRPRKQSGGGLLCGCEGHDVRTARLALFEAGELGEAHRSVEVPLAFLQGAGAIGRRHRLFAHPSVVQCLDVHPAMLTGRPALKTGWMDGVPMRDRAA